jgi:transposase
MKTPYRRVAGIDVHRVKHVATILIEREDGSTEQHTLAFGGFTRDLSWPVAWLQRYQVELVVMERTGIYWKSLCAHLERGGIETWVVNAHHIKHVPGRKTDMGDAHWLAELGRFGLVPGSFIPPQDLRELRLITRYRHKLGDTLAGEKNRRPLVLDDAGIKLGAVVSDIHGVSAQAMLEGLLGGTEPSALIELAKGRLRAKREELKLALDGYLIAAMAPYRWAWELLQTIPGIDAIAAALNLVDWRRHEWLRLGRSPRLLGPPVSRQSRECWQAPERKNAQGQQPRALPLVRGGQRGAADQKCVRLQVPGPGDPKGSQEGHRRVGA